MCTPKTQLTASTLARSLASVATHENKRTFKRPISYMGIYVCLENFCEPFSCLFMRFFCFQLFTIFGNPAYNPTNSFNFEENRIYLFLFFVYGKKYCTLSKPQE